MKRLIPLAVVALFGACNPSGSSDAGTVKPLWVSGYYVGYIPYPVDQIEWKGLTHLMVGPILPRPDGTLEVSMFAPDGLALAKAAARAARAHGVKAMAFVGGSDTGPQWAEAASDSRRAAFVSNLVRLMAEYGFDGLDLDWEPVQDADQPKLLALVKALRAAAPRAILTFPADGASNANFPPNRAFYAQLAPLLDQLNLMTYGMAGAWDGWKSWHSSPLYHADATTPTSINYSVQTYLRAGVPAGKLGIGIGLYGLCYGAPVTGPVQDLRGAKVNADDNDISYANIMTTYFSSAAHRWDTTAKVPYLSFNAPTGPKACTYISYDDPESIREKAAFVKAQGLGGAILWNVNEGFIPSRPAGQRNPLLLETARLFLGR